MKYCLYIKEILSIIVAVNCVFCIDFYCIPCNCFSCCPCFKNPGEGSGTPPTGDAGQNNNNNQQEQNNNNNNNNNNQEQNNNQGYNGNEDNKNENGNKNNNNGNYNDNKNENKNYNENNEVSGNDNYNGNDNENNNENNEENENDNENNNENNEENENDNYNENENNEVHENDCICCDFSPENYKSQNNIGCNILTCKIIGDEQFDENLRIDFNMLDDLSCFLLNPPNDYVEIKKKSELRLFTKYVLCDFIKRDENDLPQEMEKIIKLKGICENSKSYKNEYVREFIEAVTNLKKENNEYITKRNYLEGYDKDIVNVDKEIHFLITSKKENDDYIVLSPTSFIADKTYLKIDNANYVYDKCYSCSRMFITIFYLLVACLKDPTIDIFNLSQYLCDVFYYRGVPFLVLKKSFIDEDEWKKNQIFSIAYGDNEFNFLDILKTLFIHVQFVKNLSQQDSLHGSVFFIKNGIGRKQCLKTMPLEENKINVLSKEYNIDNKNGEGYKMDIHNDNLKNFINRLIYIAKVIKNVDDKNNDGYIKMIVAEFKKEQNNIERIKEKGYIMFFGFVKNYECKDFFGVPFIYMPVYGKNLFEFLKDLNKCEDKDKVFSIKMKLLENLYDNVAYQLSRVHEAGLTHMDVKLENICLSCNHDDKIFDYEGCCGFPHKMFLIDFGACVENGQLLKDVTLHTGARRGDNTDYSYLPDNIQNKINKKEYNENDKINPYIDFYSLIHVIQEICFGVIGEDNTISIDMEKINNVKDYLNTTKLKDIAVQNNVTFHDYRKDPFENIKTDTIFDSIGEDRYYEVAYYLFYLLADKCKGKCMECKDEGYKGYEKIGIFGSLINVLKEKKVF